MTGLNARFAHHYRDPGVTVDSAKICRRDFLCPVPDDPAILSFSLSMKSFLLVAIALCAPVSSLIANDTEDRIQSIRAEYHATENAKLTAREISLDDGGELTKLTKYRDQEGEVVKMVFVSGGDHGGATDHYYFKDGELYFIYQSQSYWSFDPERGEGATIDTGREQRIYYAGDRVLRHLVKEVKTGKADAVATLLAKAENQSVEDPEAATGLRLAGYRLLKVEDRAGLERYLHEE